MPCELNRRPQKERSRHCQMSCHVLWTHPPPLPLSVTPAESRPRTNSTRPRANTKTQAATEHSWLASADARHSARPPSGGASAPGARGLRHTKGRPCGRGLTHPSPSVACAARCSGHPKHSRQGMRSRNMTERATRLKRGLNALEKLGGNTGASRNSRLASGRGRRHAPRPGSQSAR